MYGSWIKTIETSIRGELVCSGGCCIAGKFCERYLCSLAVLPIVAVDTQVLLECLDCLFAVSICLWMAGGGKSSVDIELSVQLFEELRGKLRTTIRSYVSW